MGAFSQALTFPTPTLGRTDAAQNRLCGPARPLLSAHPAATHRRARTPEQSHGIFQRACLSSAQRASQPISSAVTSSTTARFRHTRHLTQHQLVHSPLPSSHQLKREHRQRRHHPHLASTDESQRTLTGAWAVVRYATQSGGHKLRQYVLVQSAEL